MQKASPFVMVLVLAVAAMVFSLRSKNPSLSAQTPATVEDFSAHPDPRGTPPAPLPGESGESAKNPQPEAKPSANPAAPATTARPWPQASSDIPPDSMATYGTLPNGLRYVIYPNSEPPKRLSLRLHIASGSLMEADDQQGLAHFLEHMVFNGSKNFKASELIPKMQRLGIGFGAHVNAYTSFDETVYMLDLPDLLPATTDLGFMVMRDFGDGALLAKEEVENERGVILSEKSSRDTVSERLMEKQFAKLLPDSLVTRRFPIGQEDVIKSAPRERFTDYYSRYYVPQRMTFIAVGDIKPEEMKAKIEATFASMTNPANPGKDPDMGPIKQAEGLETSVFADKEVSSTDVSLMLVRPNKKEPDTAATRAEDMTLDIAQSILSRRFERLSKIENSPVASGSASNSEMFDYLELGSIDVTAAGDRWQEVVPIIEQEFRRAMDHGFTEAELAEAKSNFLNAYEQNVKEKATRRSDGIAKEIVGAIGDKTVYSSPETDLELAKKALDSMTIEKCHAAFKKFWEAAGCYHLVLTTKVEPENATKDLAALFEESRGKTVDAPAARALQSFAYTNFGKAGTVRSRKEAGDLGITQLVLSNEVRVNLKPTDFEKGRVRLLARIGSGKLTLPKDMPMLDTFAAAVFEGGGLGKHSNEELKQIFAGKNVSSRLGVGDDAFMLAGSTTPADFGAQVRLMCASLTDPGYRNEGFWQIQKAIPMIYQQIRHTTAGPQQEMDSWLHGGDHRFALAPQEKLASYTIDDAKKWLTPELTKGYMELSIVGDFKTEEILPDLLATFGALRPHAARYSAPVTARKLQYANAPASKTFTYESKIPQGIAEAIWKTSGIRKNQKEFRRVNILASIYGDRLREEIREKLGASYSPSADASGSEAFDGDGYIVGVSECKPTDVEKLLTTMRDLGDKLANEGATADELDRALKPVLSSLDKSLRDNSYWLNTVMSQSQLDPNKLDLARTRDADYRAISLTEINTLAKKYLAAGNALLAGIKPAE